MTLNDRLQSLINVECAKAHTHAILLRVQSGDGQVSLTGAAGAATPDIRFPIASITKMFTAALTIQLVDEGQIDLARTVQNILTDVNLSGLHVVKGADHGPALTVRHYCTRHLALPMCAKEYTVGPQTYLRTLYGSCGAKGST